MLMCSKAITTFLFRTDTGTRVCIYPNANGPSCQAQYIDEEALYVDVE
jgi:hypothetical protein